MTQAEELQELLYTIADRKLLMSDILHFASWWRQQDDETIAYLLLKAQAFELASTLGRLK